MNRCPLCLSDKRLVSSPSGDQVQVQCGCCGQFSITGTAMAMLGGDDDPRRRLLASWVHEQGATGHSPQITADIVSKAPQIQRPSLERRTQAYLATVVRLMGEGLSRYVSKSDISLQVASWSNADDAAALGDYWVLKEAVGQTPGGTLIAGVITRIAYDQLTAGKIAIAQAFVAMSFAEDLRPVYELGLAPAISDAGYSPMRVDRKEHDGKIDDLIIAEIRRSGFTVADLTHHRAGVYYEAGFAHGLGQRVIFACRRDEIEKTHFDIRQYNILLWDSPDDLKKQLQNRILALFGAGPHKPDAKPAEA